MSGLERMMPRYKCHKDVWALKIAAINGITIMPAEDGYAAFDVTREYLAKHQPQVGGYYVVYKDGYKSFSPASAFEEGYTRTDSYGHMALPEDSRDAYRLGRKDAMAEMEAKPEPML